MRSLKNAMPPVLMATAALLAAACAHAASQAPVAAENGMVVTAQHLATRVGVDVLKDGGNAVAAAVAVGCALAVVSRSRPCATPTWTATATWATPTS